jgi:hypothetical protein
MKYAHILSIGLVVTVAFAWSAAAAVENTRELAGYCQSLERGAKGAGRHIYIPRTREALTCWGYMQAMQDLSVLADEDGHRIMGACPPEQWSKQTVCRLWPLSASSRRMDRRSASVGACVEMMIDNGASCAEVTVSRASNNSERGPRTTPSSS